MTNANVLVSYGNGDVGGARNRTYVQRGGSFVPQERTPLLWNKRCSSQRRTQNGTGGISHTFYTRAEHAIHHSFLMIVMRLQSVPCIVKTRLVTKPTTCSAGCRPTKKKKWIKRPQRWDMRASHTLARETYHTPRFLIRPHVYRQPMARSYPS